MEGPLLDLLLKNKEKLVGDVTVNGIFVCSDHNVEPEGSEKGKQLSI